MQLSNVQIIGQDGTKHIHISEGKIVRVTDDREAVTANQSTTSVQSATSGQSTTSGPGYRLHFEKAIAFPGLINSHDHLDFNLFPKLGNRVYKNYMEWGQDIHQQNKESIAAVLRVPLPIRIRWGLYKNLVNGITTVVHHGKREEVPKDLITVFQDAQSLHSVSAEKRWRWKLNNPFNKNQPLAMHIGEGTDPFAHSEIDELIKWNVLKRKLIGIHGVAMDEKQASAFRALVWCPDSNHFLLNKTAPIDRLKKVTKIVFGTDSTVSASWNIWEQMRLAREQKMMGDAELFDALTRTPADIWGLKDRGDLGHGQSADIIVANAASSWDAFYSLNPGDILLVLHEGNVRLFDGQLYDQLAGQGYPLGDFYPVIIGESRKFIQGDVPGLIGEIRKYHPSADFPIQTIP